MSNTVVETKLNKPKLRFKDANGNDFPDWVEISLRKVLKERNEYSTKDNGYTHISLTKSGVVPKTERYNRDFLVTDDLSKNYKVTRLNDLCYNPANLKFGVICLNKWGTGIFSPIYVTFEIIDQNIDFIGYYLTRNSFINKARKYEQGTVYERMAVSPADLLKVKVFLPVLQEQQKIADFLMSVDNWIDNLKAQKESLEKYKKGMMQKIFSREIRFKDDNGNDFPDWETVRLGDVFDERDERNGKNEYQMLSVSIEKGVTPQDLSLKKDSSSKDKSNYKVVYKNDIVYNTMRMWQGSSGVSIYKGIVSPAYTVVTLKRGNVGFYGYLFKLRKVIFDFFRFSQGLTSDTWNLKFHNFSKVAVTVPTTFYEQQKIADFLSSIDSQIELKQKQIENAQQWKKGLMQEMFV